MTSSPPRSRPLPAPGSAAAAPLPLLILLLLALAGCGDGGASVEPEAARPAPRGRPDTRLEVVQRDFVWHPDTTRAPSAPLSLAWSQTDEDRWEFGEGTTGAPLRGVQRLAGEGVVQLLSPAGAPLDPALHHHLVVRLRAEAPVEAVVHWTTHPGQPFEDTRSSIPQRLLPRDDFQVWSIPVASLRGWKHQRPGGRGWTKAADAAEGLHRLRLSLRGKPGTTLVVDVDSVALASDFDGRPGEPRPTTRLARDHVYTRGTTLPVPGRIHTRVEPGPRDRLRLQLAVAGADAPVTVRLGDTAAALGPLEWELEPGAPWRSVEVDLAPLGGTPGRLVLEAQGGEGRAVVLVGSVLRLAPARARRPNVVLYVEDTLRADRLQVYGYDRPTDPHLMEVARQGVVFERTFAASNWTRPATTSLLTSLDPVRHGNHGEDMRITSDLVTLAEAFADAGYVTASFVTNYHAGAWSHLEQGFDMSAEPPAFGASTITSTLTSAVLEAPLDRFLEQHDDEQLFVYVHTMDPHLPYLPVERDVEALALAGEPSPASLARIDEDLRDASRRYDAEILHNDRVLARLDETLRRLGLFEHTLLAFTSDHGESFGEHGSRYHRSDLFQPELHVPWVLRWPTQLPPGRRVDATASHVDIAPTLITLAGFRPPAGWIGRDLSTLARGNARRRFEEPNLLIHAVYGGDPEHGHREALAVVRWPYKLQAWVTPAGDLIPRALYRLDDDPHEEQDLLAHEEAAGVVRRLLAWAKAEYQQARASSVSERAVGMDPAMRNWLQEMGYLGDEGR